LAPAFVFQVVQPPTTTVASATTTTAAAPLAATTTVASASNAATTAAPVTTPMAAATTPAATATPVCPPCPPTNPDQMVDLIAARVVARLTGGQDDSALPVVKGSAPTRTPAYDMTPPPPLPAYTPASKSQVLDARVLQYFARPDDYGCIKCHGGGNSKGDVVLFDSANQWSPMKTNGEAIPKSKILEVIANRSMPKKASVDPNFGVPQEFVALVQQWAAAP
jgi:hypothetical protein